MSGEQTTGDRDKADGSPAPCKATDTQISSITKKQSFLRKNNKSPKKNSGEELKPSNENPIEETSMIRNFGTRLSKRFSLRNTDKEKTGIKSPTNKQNVNKVLEEERCDTNDQQVTNNTTERSPLSVMEINELITSKKLLEAQKNINQLEEELLNEAPSENDEIRSQEFTKQVRDLGHLCDALAKQIKCIVSDSLTEENGDRLSSALKVIEAEEIADGKWLERTPQAEDKLFGRPRRWREMWRDTIAESVRKRVSEVPLEKKEANKSWIALHLANLQITLCKDLKTIKNVAQKCYPEEDTVCDLYVKCYHENVSSHLRELARGDLELNDLSSFLKWVTHTYQSEGVMGHPDLLPEVNVQELSPLIDEEMAKNVKDRYLKALQSTVKELMIRTLEGEEKAWLEGEEAEELMGYYHSDITHHISKMIHDYVKESGNISIELENEASLISLDELIHLVQSYQQKLRAFIKDVCPNTLSVVVASINSFSELREFVENLKQSHTGQDNKTEKALDDAVQDFNEFLLNQVLIQVKPYFKKLMTKRWLSNSEDFDNIIRLTEEYYQKFKKIKPTNCQVLANDIHYQFVKIYITQIMKQRIRCNLSSKRETAASKIKAELGRINMTCEELGSTESWLVPAAKHLADFIGDSKNELEGHLSKLYEVYQDIGPDHVSALLYFRGISRGRRKNRLIKQLGNNLPEQDTKRLFRDIDVPVTVSCMP